MGRNAECADVGGVSGASGRDVTRAPGGAAGCGTAGLIPSLESQHGGSHREGARGEAQLGRAVQQKGAGGRDAADTVPGGAAIGGVLPSTGRAGDGGDRDAGDAVCVGVGIAGIAQQAGHCHTGAGCGAGRARTGDGSPAGQGGGVVDRGDGDGGAGGQRGGVRAAIGSAAIVLDAGQGDGAAAAGRRIVAGVLVGQAVDQGLGGGGGEVAGLGDGDCGGTAGHTDADGIAVGRGGGAVAVGQRHALPVDAQGFRGAVGQATHRQGDGVDALARLTGADGRATEQRDGVGALDIVGTGRRRGGQGRRLVDRVQRNGGAGGQGGGVMTAVGRAAVVLDGGQGDGAAAAGRRVAAGVLVGQAVDQGLGRGCRGATRLGDGDGGGAGGHRDRDAITVGGGGDAGAVDQGDVLAVNGQDLRRAVGQAADGQGQATDLLAGLDRADGRAAEQAHGTAALGEDRAGGRGGAQGGRVVDGGDVDRAGDAGRRGNAVVHRPGDGAAGAGAAQGRVLAGGTEGDAAQGGLVIGQGVAARQGQHAGAGVVAAGDVGGVDEGQHVARHHAADGHCGAGQGAGGAIGDREGGVDGAGGAGLDIGDGAAGRHHRALRRDADRAVIGGIGGGAAVGGGVGRLARAAAAGGAAGLVPALEGQRGGFGRAAVGHIAQLGGAVQQQAAAGGNGADAEPVRAIGGILPGAGTGEPSDGDARDAMAVHIGIAGVAQDAGNGDGGAGRVDGRGRDGGGGAAAGQGGGVVDRGDGDGGDNIDCGGIVAPVRGAAVVLDNGQRDGAAIAGSRIVAGVLVA
ncbi:PE-PGRS family protein [Nitrospirillum viridazoti Y2]|nr:PE-PGRS family protein [Nitrospirillum amazonense Y2]